MSDFNSELIRQLADILGETGLTEIEYDTGKLRVRVVRQAHNAAIAVTPLQEAITSQSQDSGTVAVPADMSGHPGCVKAPMVGVAFLAPEPGAENFVKVGDEVSEGETLLLIEAMKTFNPVRAPKSGKVAFVLVSNGTPVEFEEPLLVIE